jgi:hypothetical protein
MAFISQSYGTSADTTTGLGLLNASLATLVADGASPTQAHVTAVANAVQGLGFSNTPAVFLCVDASLVTSVGALRNVLNTLVLRLAGLLTA